MSRWSCGRQMRGSWQRWWISRREYRWLTLWRLVAMMSYRGYFQVGLMTWLRQVFLRLLRWLNRSTSKVTWSWRYDSVSYQRSWCTIIILRLLHLVVRMGLDLWRGILALGR